jgi:RNA ligase (TIGR02306 family)
MTKTTINKIMEKYAVVARVLELAPIEGADRIETATVLGWKVVTQKYLHSVGDLVVMIFPDTLVPKKFLDGAYQGDDKVRLKTVKLKGQYSAGLLLPMSVVGNSFNEGDEVSELLGIEKWVAPAAASIAGDAAGNFPTGIISKTDEFNVRSEPNALNEARLSPLVNQEFVITLKCDGSSGTFIAKNGEFRVCSRNLELKETEGNAFWQVAKKYSLHEKLLKFGDNTALQGEVCGPGIQGNPMKLTELTFFAFLMKDIKHDKWLSWDTLKTFCRENQIPHVEELTVFKFTETSPTLEELQEIANNAKYDHGRTNAEGIVIRPVSPVRSLVLQKPWWSLKVMNQPYDMKKG